MTVLKRLESLYMIACHYLGLRGLNLKKISYIEGHVRLWEVWQYEAYTFSNGCVCFP